MYRRVVLYKSTWDGGPFEVLYHVRGARLFSQSRVSETSYDSSYTTVAANNAMVFVDSIRLKASTGIGTSRAIEFILDVSENQPTQESIEELTNTGCSAIVFNENGVVVCSNGVSIPASSAPAQTVGPGEMTSEPIGGPGEMTSEPIDGPREMASEPIDGPGEMM